MRACRVVIAALIVVAGRAAAQNEVAPPGRCTVNRETDRCPVVLITNAGVYGVASTLRGSFPLRYVLDWGLLFPVGHRFSAGVSVLASLDADGLLAGPALRVRGWSASGKSSAEIALGTSFRRDQDGPTVPLYGMLKWNISPVAGIALRPEWRREADYSCQFNVPAGCVSRAHGTVSISAGVELAGWRGAVLTGASLLLGFVAIIAYLSGEE